MIEAKVVVEVGNAEVFMDSSISSMDLNKLEGSEYEKE